MSKKIRNLTDLQTAMDGEFVWRKRELHNLKSVVDANKANHRCDLHIRAAVTLLYAHWEGFIKAVADFYLEFVAEQDLKYSDLAACFLAVAIRLRIHRASPTSKIQPCLDVVEFFRKGTGDKSEIPWTSAVRTEANLSSTVLREIVATLGLDYSRFQTKEKLLDEKLLRHRNTIAHGKFLTISFAEYMDLHEEVFSMMRDFYNQIDNAATMGDYRA